MSRDRLSEVADLAVERSRKRKAAAAEVDATHDAIAHAWLDSLAIDQHRPVFTGGAFHAPLDSGLWGLLSMEQAQVQIGAKFRDCKRCKRQSDYKQIATHAGAIAEDSEFFARAPVGVVSPGGFWRLGVDHVARIEPLRLEHRQQFQLEWEPDFEAEAVRVDALLQSAFEGDHADDQIDLVWQLIGAMLFGLLPAHQCAALFIGKEKTGKSTLQRLVEKAFPASAVAAVAPAVWSREYNVAALAGKRLNVVGELADDAPIPAAAFKNVTGGNLLEGRHPTHRPFYFVPLVSHLFASNVLPPTTDRTEAFFRRWRIVRFKNRVPDGRADPGLLQKIVADEMPAFLASAFAGAGRVASSGQVRTTPAHDEVMAKWKAAANPVLQFLLDDAWVTLDPGAVPVPTPEVYAAYRKWASNSGFRNPFGRNHFLELVDTTGATHGVTLGRSETRPVIRGLALRTAADLPDF